MAAYHDLIGDARQSASPASEQGTDPVVDEDSGTFLGRSFTGNVGTPPELQGARAPRMSLSFARIIAYFPLVSKAELKTAWQYAVTKCGGISSQPRLTLGHVNFDASLEPKTARTMILLRDALRSKRKYFKALGVFIFIPIFHICIYIYISLWLVMSPYSFRFVS